MMLIYGLIDGTTLELRYVGKTTKSLTERLAKHQSFRSTNHHLNNWLRSTDVSIIILNHKPNDLDEAEINWIRKMRTQGARLLNIADGGTGGFTGRHNTETRAKIRASHIGMKHTVEVREKISVKTKDAMTPEHCAKLRAAHLGKPLSLEHRAKISAGQIGRVQSEATRMKISMTKRGIKGC